MIGLIGYIDKDNKVCEEEQEIREVGAIKKLFWFLKCEVAINIIYYIHDEQSENYVEIEASNHKIISY